MAVVETPAMTGCRRFPPRAQLADAIDMKRVPELRFVFDGFVRSNDTEEPGA